LVNGRADGGLVALYIDEPLPHVGNDNRPSIATIGGLLPHSASPSWGDDPHDASIAQRFGRAWIEDR